MRSVGRIGCKQLLAAATNFLLDATAGVRATCAIDVGAVRGSRRCLSIRAVGQADGRQAAADTVYIVRVFEKPHWRTVLTTEDMAEALAMAKEIGDKVRVDTVTPKPDR